MVEHREMSLARAREIVTAVCQRGFYTMGLCDVVQSLDGVSLPEMVEAAALVGAANRMADASPGPKVIQVVPDHRLIAAVYALEHFTPDDTPIVLLPPQRDGAGHKAISVVMLSEGGNDE